MDTTPTRKLMQHDLDAIVANFNLTKPDFGHVIQRVLDKDGLVANIRCERCDCEASRRPVSIAPPQTNLFNFSSWKRTICEHPDALRAAALFNLKRKKKGSGPKLADQLNEAWAKSRNFVRLGLAARRHRERVAACNSRVKLPLLS
jgi:hypothetical protein